MSSRASPWTLAATAAETVSRAPAAAPTIAAPTATTVSAEATAADILAIPLDAPDRLFPDPAAVEARFHDLARRWHPDVNRDPAAGAVFAHVAALRDAACKAAAPAGGEATWTSRDGRSFRFRFVKRVASDVGAVLIGKTSIALVAEAGFAAEVDNARRLRAAIRFPSARHAADLQRCLPSVVAEVETADAHVTIVGKPDDAVRLEDLIAHLGGRIPAVHVAWLISSLMNFACLLQVSGLTHNGLTPASVWVSPRRHAALPLDGWWSAAPAGGRLSSLPAEIHALATPAMLAGKRADPRLDLAAIQAIGRAALGDRSGASLTERDAPAPMLGFLKLPNSGDAIRDYRTWHDRVVPDSFGARRFVELPVSFSDVY